MTTTDSTVSTSTSASTSTASSSNFGRFIHPVILKTDESNYVTWASNIEPLITAEKTSSFEFDDSVPVEQNLIRFENIIYTFQLSETTIPDKLVQAQLLKSLKITEWSFKSSISGNPPDTCVDTLSSDYVVDSGATHHCVNNISDHCYYELFSRSMEVKLCGTQTKLALGQGQGTSTFTSREEATKRSADYETFCMFPAFDVTHSPSRKLQTLDGE